MSTKTTVKCPNCNTEIDVNEILYHQLEADLNKKNIKDKKQYQKAIIELEQREKDIKKQTSEFEQTLKKATNDKLEEERQNLEKIIKKNLQKELQEEQKQAFNSLQEELEEKSKQIQILNKTKIEIEKLKRENKEIESKIKADTEIILSKKLEQERERIQKLADQTNELKFKQKEEQLKQLQKQLQTAQRKAEQGSIQLQGEVQELAIEEYLISKYPFDIIQEIKKGARGADCIQTVQTRDLRNCGKIYYESKRTKEFNKNWIEKFKSDMRDKAIDIGVLVTATLPSNQERMGLIDGIWVCSFEEFKGLSAVLRDGIIKINYIQKKQENKKDKMSLLYSYLTSTEFKMQIEAIVEGFTTMKGDLDKEKRAMMRIWKQREKQIDKVLDNTITMYGSVKGIAGNAIQTVSALELPYDL